MLIKKISASELSRKLVKSALLVGREGEKTKKNMRIDVSAGISIPLSLSLTSKQRRVLTSSSPPPPPAPSCLSSPIPEGCLLLPLLPVVLSSLTLASAPTAALWRWEEEEEEEGCWGCCDILEAS